MINDPHIPNARVTDDFKIELPQEYRTQERWQPGQPIMFVRQANGMLMKPVPTMQELKGCMKGANTEGYRDREDRY